MNASTEFLFDAALRGAGVLALALMLGVLLRSVAAARRYALWTAAMVLLAVLPIAMQMLPGWHVLPQEHEKPLWELPQAEMPLEATAQPVEVEMVALPETEPVADLKPVSSPEPVLAAQPALSWKPRWEHLPLFWLVVAAGMLLRLFISAWRLHRLEKTLPEGACAELDRIARQLGLSRAPKLLIGAADAVPMVWGVWRARLLLPRGFESWSTEKLRGVLHHELAHLRRRDPLMLWLAQAVKALHWFNPLAWLTLRALRADQERACDDSVLRAGVRPSDYAQHLLDLSRHSRAAPGLALCALTMTRCAPVESRVRDILDPKRPREPLTKRWLLALLVFAALGLLPAAMLRAIEAPKLRGRILDRHGRVLAETTEEKMRTYPLRSLAAHLVGYVGKTKFDNPTPKGRAGVEKQQEATLQGGKDVKLTLDARLQAIAMRAMREAGIAQGAAVVLDPRTGEVLASVSMPGYDLNAFVPNISIERWDELAKDAALPLLDRAFRGQYPPGGSFGGLTALAGLAAGKGTEKFQCTGSVTFGSRVYRCWKGDGHGLLDLTGAMEQSCNCFWYRFANVAGSKAMESMAGHLGLGQTIPHLDTADGYFPSGEGLKNSERGGWTAADLANVAIGQGRMLVTPLQTAILAATLANGGKVPVPNLIHGEGEPKWRADLMKQGVSSEQIALVREGMRRVVNSDTGTARITRSDRVQIAAKTGTVQWRVSKNQHLAVMMGFAPFDDPKLAFAVFSEGAPNQNISGGSTCGPVVKRIVEDWLDLPADGSGDVKMPDEASAASLPGNLPDLRQQIEQVANSMKGAVTLEDSRLTTDRAVRLRRGAGGGLEVLGESGEWLPFPSPGAPGSLRLSGEASGMIAALAFRQKVIELSAPHDLEWTFPVPKTLEDGMRVRFEMVAESRLHAELRKTRGQSVVTSPLPTLASDMAAPSIGWPIFRMMGQLAELPAEAEVLVVPPRASLRVGEREMVFNAPREVVLKWLRESLRDSADEAKGWPGSEGPFSMSCECGRCKILCVSMDGKTASVWITLQGWSRLDPSPFLLPPFRSLPEGPTIPKNLPEDKKPNTDRMANWLPSIGRGLPGLPPIEDPDDPLVVERRIQRQDRTLVR